MALFKTNHRRDAIGVIGKLRKNCRWNERCLASREEEREHRGKALLMISLFNTTQNTAL